jgi:hypothetical protein
MARADQSSSARALEPRHAARWRHLGETPRSPRLPDLRDRPPRQTESALATEFDAPGPVWASTAVLTPAFCAHFLEADVSAPFLRPTP